MESYESRHSSHTLAAAVAQKLGIKEPSLRADSQVRTRSKSVFALRPTDFKIYKQHCKKEYFDSGSVFCLSL